MLGVLSIASGVGKIIGGIGASRRAKREERKARREYNSNKAAFMSTDTSNPFANVTNTYEDLQVNTQQADFVAQQQQQGLANTLESLSGAAGGGGIAALAQSLAQQQSYNLQAASASIGQQEASNQRLAAQGEASAQQLRGRGEMMSQQMEMNKTSTLLGMSQQRLAAARQAKAAATSSIIGGVAGIAGGVAKGAILGKDAKGGLFKKIGAGLKTELGSSLDLKTEDKIYDFAKAGGVGSSVFDKFPKNNNY
jgi:hypothetical protein